MPLFMGAKRNQESDDKTPYTRTCHSTPYEYKNPEYSANSKPMHLYCINPSPKKWQKYWKLLAIKDSILNGKIGKYGERYARHIFIRAKYKQITYAKRLGKAIAYTSQGEKIYADMLVTSPWECLPLKAFVQIKNTRETHNKDNKALKKLEKQALETNRQPVFVAPHISESAKKDYEIRGIAVLELGAQIIDNRHKAQLHKLPQNVLGRHEAILVTVKRPSQYGTTSETQALIDIVSNPEWLRTANQTWRALNPLATCLGIDKPKAK